MVVKVLSYLDHFIPIFKKPKGTFLIFIHSNVVENDTVAIGVLLEVFII